MARPICALLRVILDDRGRVERGPDDHRGEALLGDPIELAPRQQRRVQRQDRDRMHPPVGLGGEVPDPVVVALRECSGRLRVLHERAGTR